MIIVTTSSAFRCRSSASNFLSCCRSEQFFFFFGSVKPSKRNCLIRIAQSSDRIVGQQRDRYVKGDLHEVVHDMYRVVLYFQNVTWFHGALLNVISFAHVTYEALKHTTYILQTSFRDFRSDRRVNKKSAIGNWFISKN